MKDERSEDERRPKKMKESERRWKMMKETERTASEKRSMYVSEETSKNIGNMSLGFGLTMNPTRAVTLL